MTVERLNIAPKPGHPQTEVAALQLTRGAGIDGDRYYRAADEPGQNLTLVEAEVIEAFCATAGRPVDLACTRRNVVTRGVRLNELVGREFSIGEVRLRGVELCEPCMGLGTFMASPDLAPAAIVKQLVHRAGLRADVLSSGRIAHGDSFECAPHPSTKAPSA